MVASDAKRVVVIRNISSNLIEEAILVLRNEPGSGLDEKNGDTGRQKHRIDKDFLVKEAEALINSYIKENRMQIKYDSRNKRGLKILESLRGKPLVNLIVNALFLGSIVLLIYIVCRLI